MQLMISWVVMRVLEGLNQREGLVTADLNGRGEATLTPGPSPFEGEGR
jgi:hypothetical protein